MIANVYLKKGASPVKLDDYPLIKESKTKLDTANELHQQFLKFKAGYEGREKQVRQGDKISA